MNTRFKYIILIGLSVLAIIIGLNQYALYKTKQFSPVEKALYQTAQIEVEVDYSRPKKSGRVIFGELVPYGRWWRTGANEPTQFDLSRDISFDGQKLSAGLYSLVTIPEEKSWTVVFNNRVPDWGTDYYPEDDALRIVAPVEILPNSVELFTIDFSEENGQPRLIFAWDNVKVTLPFDVL